MRLLQYKQLTFEKRNRCLLCCLIVSYDHLKWLFETGESGTNLIEVILYIMDSVANTKYAVVEFKVEKTIAAVPSLWLDRKDDMKICYWPKSKPGFHSKKCSIPDKKLWSQHEIHLFQSADTYLQALQLVRLAEETSNLEDDYKVCSGNVKRPRLFLPPESDSDDNVTNPPKSKLSKSKALNCLQLPITFPLTRKTFTGTKDNLANNIFASSTLCNLSEAQNEIINSTPVDSQISNFAGQDYISDEEDNNSKQSLSSTEYFENNHIEIKLNQIIKNQNLILELLSKIIGTTSPSEELITANFVQLTTEEELDQLCRQIKDSKDLENAMVIQLNTLGGRSLNDCIRRILKKLATNELLSKYSLKGKKGKKIFVDLPICGVITKACMRNFPNSKVTEIEYAIGEVLKYAPKKVKIMKKQD